MLFKRAVEYEISTTFAKPLDGSFTVISSVHHWYEGGDERRTSFSIESVPCYLNRRLRCFWKILSTVIMTPESSRSCFEYSVFYFLGSYNSCKLLNLSDGKS